MLTFKDLKNFVKYYTIELASMPSNVIIAILGLFFTLNIGTSVMLKHDYLPKGRALPYPNVILGAGSSFAYIFYEV